ncbi:MAG: hypothetical protein ACYTF0_08055 [Planctomycetota bacterium]
MRCLLHPAPVLIATLLLTACGVQRPVAVIDEAPEELVVEEVVVEEVASEAPISAEAILAGEQMPASLRLVTIPGFGYRIGDQRIDLATLDRVLAVIAKHNRFTDIQVRVPAGQARAASARPVIDLCERHRLACVGIDDGLRVVP